MFATTFLKAEYATTIKTTTIRNDEPFTTLETSIRDQARFYAEWSLGVITSVLFIYLVFFIIEKGDKDFKSFCQRFSHPYAYLFTPTLLLVTFVGVVAQYRDLIRREEAVKNALDFTTLAA